MLENGRSAIGCAPAGTGRNPGRGSAAGLPQASPRRRLPGGDRPKVVFCTTENDVVHIARALHAGANEYIMKPFDKEIVEAKFQEVGLI